MFYEEKVIDGVLCWRGIPSGEWNKKTPEQLTQMLIEARRERDGLARGDTFAHYLHDAQRDCERLAARERLKMENTTIAASPLDITVRAIAQEWKPEFEFSESAIERFVYSYDEADKEASEIFMADFNAALAEAVQAEREACAVTAWMVGMSEHNKAHGLPCDAREVGSACAQAIRARSN